MIHQYSVIDDRRQVEFTLFDDEDTTCSQCGLSTDLCICETIAREETRIKVVLSKRKWGKIYTLLSGFDKTIDVKKLGKTLRTKLACGGSVKNDVIELQGNHEFRIKEVLENLQFDTDSIDIIRQF